MPPAILTQPQSQTNAVGGSATFSVLATGTAPLTYQWLSNGVPLVDGGRLAGAYSNQLTLAGLQLADAGNHSVVVSNAFGSAVSSNALLVVTTNLTWTGAISSDWNNPGNWNPSQVPGSGNYVIINSGSVTIPASAAFAVMDWASGGVNGVLTVASNAVLNLSGSGIKNLSGPLINYGTVVWSDTGDVFVNNNNTSNPNGRIVNQPGGLFEAQNDQTLRDAAGNGFAVFDNAGIFRKRLAAGTTTVGTRFNNAGTVEAQSGTLVLQGIYSNAPAANLAVALGGAAPGSDYGQINFAQPPTFDGTFSVSTRNGYRPNPGATFQVLSYPSATNTFLCMSGLDLGSGILLQPQFGKSGLTLTAAAYTPGSEPQLLISRWPAGILLQWPLGFPDWVLQSTTTISPRRSGPWCQPLSPDSTFGWPSQRSR